jgi:hypothetical protein
MHLLESGDGDRIDLLARAYAKYSKLDNVFVFVKTGGEITEEMRQDGAKVYVLNGSKDTSFSTFEEISRIMLKYEIDTVVVQDELPLLHFYGRSLQMVKKDLRVIPFLHNNPENYETRGYLADKAMKMVVMQSFQNASKVIAATVEIQDTATKVLGIKPDKISVLAHMSLDKPQEFAAELDAVLRLEKI